MYVILKVKTFADKLEFTAIKFYLKNVMTQFKIRLRYNGKQKNKKEHQSNPFPKIPVAFSIFEVSPSVFPKVPESPF